MTGVAWGFAYANGIGTTVQIAFAFVLGHFLGVSLLISTLMYFLVGRVLGKRRQGLFGPPTGGEEGLEFGYCFDVSALAWWYAQLLTKSPGLDTRVSACVGIPLRPAIPSHATDCAGLLGLESVRQYHVPTGTELLLRCDISGLQWYDIFVTT